MGVLESQNDEIKKKKKKEKQNLGSRCFINPI